MFSIVIIILEAGSALLNSFFGLFLSLVPWHLQFRETRNEKTIQIFPKSLPPTPKYVEAHATTHISIRLLRPITNECILCHKAEAIGALVRPWIKTQLQGRNIQQSSCPHLFSGDRGRSR